jgi:hypothetical protein
MEGCCLERACWNARMRAGEHEKREDVGRAVPLCAVESRTDAGRHTLRLDRATALNGMQAA